ncbi:Xaa-Pro peptidase family protein [Algoriphagus aquimarinus]|uniref:Xaa-Pro peptidase family protein n=1 Tax=Algoriphagus aquimarinus TaxID=237018 RepID=UPI0030DB2B71|tara:strand:- start:19938 stop:21389 length:1452 start_codon:yes stop_codon:yes gene_type:complete
MKIKNTITVLLFLLSIIPAIAQEKNYYQTDFSKEEFATRRAKIFVAIGNQSIAVIQGAGGTPGVSVFRQSNSFYYLTGIESPHAYLLINGKSKKSTLYLQHRDEGMERNQGKVLSAEDAELVKELTGIDEVKGIEKLASDLSGAGGLVKPSGPALFVEFSPVESGNDSRDELLSKQIMAASDPWDGAASREANFIAKLKATFPQFEIKDLTPTLDNLRLIKSEKEIAIIRKATEIAGLAIIEAMKSTKPGVYEYQLGAAGKYVFSLHGAMGDSYPAIIGGGTNAYMGHYFQKTDQLVDGDLVLMDYAPDYKYYSSDVTRIWPVNGKFTDEQRALYEFIIAYRDALFRHIKPGVTSNEVLDQTAAEMKKYMVGKAFVKPAHLKAVEEGIKFRGHFQHPVGMIVHDVGRVHGVKLEPGMVFTIDPMIWIHEERLYVRIEDVAVVTKDGVENLSAFVPTSIAEIEQTISEKGIIDFSPAVKLPLDK